jgi:hypothetical protein
MKRIYSVALALLVASVTFAAPAFAAPRSPQIPFAGAALQSRLTSLGESINVLTQQQDGLVWGSTVSSNSTMTIQFDLNGNPSGDELGIAKLNASGNVVTGLAKVFPANADSGWFAVASFRPGGALIVNLFDENATAQPGFTYTGVNRSLFGYYVKRGANTFYSHDGFNSDGNAHALAYAGTGQNTGCWWLCWEDLPVASYGSSDFDDAILFIESQNPTPANHTSWGSLKSRFR